MDTSKDYRLLLVESVLNAMKNDMVSNRLQLKYHKREAIECIDEMLSTVQMLKYSYMEIGELAACEAVAKISELTAKMKNAIDDTWPSKIHEEAPKLVADMIFFFHILEGLGERLKLGEENKASNAVDIFASEIMSVSKHPSLDLMICNVNAGKSIRVITNVMTVKARQRVAVAMLRPAEFGGVISEGMFVFGGAAPTESAGTRPALDEHSLKEVDSFVISMVRGFK